MSGATVLRYLIAHDAAVLAVVPAARIMDDDPTPGNAAFPLVTLNDISSVPYNLLRMNELPRLHTDRVQVTAQFKDQHAKPAGTGKAGCKALLRLILTACQSQRGTVAGIIVDSIAPDVQGPPLHDYAAGIWEQSRDFIVRWIEPAAASTADTLIGEESGTGEILMESGDSIELEETA